MRRGAVRRSYRDLEYENAQTQMSGLRPRRECFEVVASPRRIIIQRAPRISATAPHYTATRSLPRIGSPCETRRAARHNIEKFLIRRLIPELGSNADNKRAIRDRDSRRVKTDCPS